MLASTENRWGDERLRQRDLLGQWSELLGRAGVRVKEDQRRRSRHVPAHDVVEQPGWRVEEVAPQKQLEIHFEALFSTGTFVIVIIHQAEAAAAELLLVVEVREGSEAGEGRLQALFPLLALPAGAALLP